MKSIAQLAQLIRNGEVGQILGEIKESPAVLNQTDETGLPLSHLLALKGQLDLVETQLDAAALESVWDLSGWTLAHTAAAAGSAQPLKKLLEKNQHVLCWEDWRGRTPIHIAAQHAHLDQFSVDAPHLTARDHLQSTPLHLAALNSCLYQVVDKLVPEMLLMVNLQGETVLELAAELSKKNPAIPKPLRNLAWEAEFINQPTKRTVENVLRHYGIIAK